MENASKALVMAGGVLIGVLILTLAVYLFIDFGQQASEIHNQITSNQLTQFNAQFNIYEGLKDVTIYQIISMANLAYENNKKEDDETYKVKVFLDLGGRQEVSKNKYSDNLEFIKENNSVKEDDGEIENLFNCYLVRYHENGRVSEVYFQKAS